MYVFRIRRAIFSRYLSQTCEPVQLGMARQDGCIPISLLSGIRNLCRTRTHLAHLSSCFHLSGPSCFHLEAEAIAKKPTVTFQSPILLSSTLLRKHVMESKSRKATHRFASSTYFHFSPSILELSPDNGKLFF